MLRALAKKIVGTATGVTAKAAGRATLRTLDDMAVGSSVLTQEAAKLALKKSGAAFAAPSDNALAAIGLANQPPGSAPGTGLTPNFSGLTMPPKP